MFIYFVIILCMKYEDDNKKYILDPLSEFVKFMKKTIKEKKVSKRDVFGMAEIPVSYGYKILLGEKRTKQRDVIIRICYVANFNVEEIQEALRLYEMPELYNKIFRDKIILEAFESSDRDINIINDKLKQNKLASLKECGEDN